LFGVSPSTSTLVNLVIVYGNVTNPENEPLSQLNVTLLQIGNVTAPLSNGWTICVSGTGHEDCYVSRSSLVRSLIVAIPRQGDYSVRMFSDSASGFLETKEGISLFSVASTRSFVEQADLFPFPATLHATGTPLATPTPTWTFTISLQSQSSSRQTVLLRTGWFVLAVCAIL
jgi:hypothetical protein